MKNKIISLSLLITALSVVPAFAATNSTCNNVDLSNLSSKGVSISNISDYLSDGNKDISELINNCTNKNITTNLQNINTDANKSSVETEKTNVETKKATTTNKQETTTNDKTTNTSKQEATTNKTESTNTNSSVSSYEKQVVDLVNAERSKNGLSALTLDSSVSNVARTKSKDMATNNYFSHTSPTYGSAGSMLSQFGIKYTAWGENIAAGQKTPQEVVTAWMNSEGHRANILSSDFTKIGVGYATNSSGKAYWTQMFTR